jgi:phosphatidylserine/phosphatidylglycerophosphate/cardiolipin synthase-like enzyme
MRALKTGNVLAVRAIGGLHVVTLAWDFIAGQENRREKLLGFAIERSKIENGSVTERYFIRGIKRFKNKDEGLAPATPVPTSEHPIQSFQWGDYTVSPDTHYRYSVVPVYGKPKLLDLDMQSATSVDIKTEPEVEAAHGGKVRHEVYFNRGAAGSQAYARKFGKKKPDEHAPESEQMKWLSRGLFEALTRFIGRASGQHADRFKLRAMLYEFKYLPVGKAFAAAKRDGADVDIRYEAKSYKEENEEMITKAGIKRICKPQKSRAGIRHNKFIVLIENDVPVAVWTGSTNISAGGIFGHSNVGHVVWNTKIAQDYLDYWDDLAKEDVNQADLKEECLAIEPTPARGSLPDPDRVLRLFSPRDTKDKDETLHWYGDLFGSQRRIICMTFAFNVDEFFVDCLKKRDGTLRYAMLDKKLDPDVEEDIETVGNSVVAAGSKFKKGDIVHFLEESLTGFNRNYYIHNKFMVVDPLGADPIVVTGSANFSKASQVSNDENMLVIRGDTRIADIYFGEFMRMFDHHYSRYISEKIRESGESDPDAGYLKENWNEWVPGHFKSNGRKELRRKYFMEE